MWFRNISHRLLQVLSLLSTADNNKNHSVHWY